MKTRVLFLTIVFLLISFIFAAASGLATSSSTGVSLEVSGGTPTPTPTSTPGPTSTPTPAPTATPTPTPAPTLPLVVRVFDFDASGRIEIGEVFSAVGAWVKEWKEILKEEIALVKGEAIIPRKIKRCDLNRDGRCDLIDLSILLYYVGR